MNANHPRLLFLVVLAVLSLAAAACGSADDAGIATVGAATLSQAEFEANLGCVVPATFISEFVAGAAAVDSPGISEPVQSQFGWHVIQVRSFGPVVRGEHDELTPEQITSFVLENHVAERQGLQAGLYDRDISVDPRFGVFDATSGVVVSGTAQTDAGSLDATAS